LGRTICSGTLCGVCLEVTTDGRNSGSGSSRSEELKKSLMGGREGDDADDYDEEDDA
jgi:hypothetical protein